MIYPPLKRMRKYLPGGAPRIDWSNPLTAGLFACYVPSASGGKKIDNIIGCGLNLKVEASSSWNNLQEGTALNSFAATSGADVQGIPTILRPSSQSSVFWRGTFDGSQAGTNVPLIAISYANPEADPFFVFGIVNGANAANAVCTYWNTGSVGSVGNGTNISLPATNKITSIAGTFKIGENARLYYDGIIKDTVAISAGSGAFLYSSTSNVCLGNYLPTLSRIGHCSTLIGMMWNRQLTASEVLSISKDPYQFLIYPEDEIFALMAAQAISQAPGAFTLTGVSANLLFGRKNSEAVGTFALTGVAASLKSGRKSTQAPGAFTLTGVAANLLFGRKIAAALGTFSLTGVAANLLAQKKLSATVGAFVLTGVAASLKAGKKISEAVGSFSLTGIAANLLMQRKLSALVASFSLTGVAALLKYGHVNQEQAGNFVLTGKNANLLAENLLSLNTGSFSLHGFDVHLLAQRTLETAHGSFNLNGINARLAVSRFKQVDPGAFILTGIDVIFTRKGANIYSRVRLEAVMKDKIYLNIRLKS